ncbi:hypothetical protein [Acholeplasma palmae]|uniref:hypothetical protein n=1 Tax=Acholeplasma palmae TaxID=38986 RepID=UPI000AD0CAE4|nr:hypothetical protein [Alteracholeplasma palmae]
MKKLAIGFVTILCIMLTLTATHSYWIDQINNTNVVKSTEVQHETAAWASI